MKKEAKIISLNNSYTASSPTKENLNEIVKDLSQLLYEIDNHLETPLDIGDSKVSKRSKLKESKKNNIH